MEPVKSTDMNAPPNDVGHTSVDSLIIADTITQLKQLLSGALSGCLTRFLIQPMDVIKIRFQLQLEPLSKQNSTNASKYTSMMQAFKIIYKEEGIRGLWRGHNAGQVMSITYNMSQFWAYERVVQPIRLMPCLENHKYMAEFIAGGSAGVFGSLVSLPLDVVRTRVVAQDPGAGYRNTINGLSELFRNEGMRGCFRGTVPTLVQIVPMMGGNFMFYVIFQTSIRKLQDKPTEHLPTWVNLLCGAAAGAVSKTIFYPFDFLKKRMQIQGFEENRKTFGRNQGCGSMISCIKMTSKEEGILGFYKGLSPSLMKASASTALFFGLYDFFKIILKI